jgi:hypothetical protein
MDYYCLTNRSSALEPERSLRSDEIRLTGGLSFLDVRNDIFFVHAIAGGGGLFFGDFGSTWQQEWFHGTFGANHRPITHEYDESNTFALAYLYADIGDTIGIGSNLATWIQLLHTGDIFFSSTLGVWLPPKQMLKPFYSVGIKENIVSSLNGTASAVYDAESGIWISGTMFVGYVYLERAYNAVSGTMQSAIGIVTPFGMTRPATESVRYDYSFGFVFGVSSNVEMFRVRPFRDFPNIDGFIRIQGIEIFEPGAPTEQTRVFVGTAGAEYFLFAPDDDMLVNPFVLCGFGILREKLITNDAYNALEIAGMIMPVLDCGAGVRFRIPDIIFGNPDLNYGFELTWHIHIGLGSESIWENPHNSFGYGFYVSER